MTVLGAIPLLLMAGNEDGEAPLEGGFRTEVHRQGDRTFRNAHALSSQVHELLIHLEDVGFEAAPSSLGFDGRGRHIVEFLPGEVATGRPPGWVWRDEVLISLAGIVRRFHDAVAVFDYSGDVWPRAIGIEQLPSMPGDETIVCHNDIAPWNTVFQDRQPVALIDWDSAAVGTRCWDVAYALWHYVPLYPAYRREQVGASQVDNLLERASQLITTYGLSEEAPWMDAVVCRQRATKGELERRAGSDDKAAALWAEARPHLDAEIEFVERLARRWP